jgi:hypothetical protein
VWYHLGLVFWNLISIPFHHSEMVWGIVPLYFGWILNEMTSAKKSFQTALQTGFALVWGGSHWLWMAVQHDAHYLRSFAQASANLVVTIAVIAIGIVALRAGIRRRYPKFLGFLGHSRFGNYFLIAIYPIQAGAIPWTLDRVEAIALFAVPIWIAVNLAFIPVRR